MTKLGAVRPWTTIDLFSGAGGITEGFRHEGFECIFANDVSRDALQTFKLNHPSAEVALGPVQDLNPVSVRRGLDMLPGELDCLVGGPPCQGFSINAPSRFLTDPRNKLFLEYVRFLEEFRPKTFLFENVPGLLSLAGGAVGEQILKHFIALGYDVRLRILFAAHYGVPQERWRLIILGSRIGEAPDHPAPTHNAVGRANFTGGRSLTIRLDELTCAFLKPFVAVADAIGDLPVLEAGGGAEDMEYTKPPTSRYSEELRLCSDRVKNHVAPKIARINLERLKYIKPGGSWRDIPFELLPAGMKQARSSDHTKRYGRLRPDGLSGTVMTKVDPHWGPAFHYEQDRTLTVREAARLQSFPDCYLFTGPRVSQYEQVGNAVPVLMAKAIGLSIANSLEQTAN